MSLRAPQSPVRTKCQTESLDEGGKEIFISSLSAEVLFYYYYYYYLDIGCGMGS